MFLCFGTFVLGTTWRNGPTINGNNHVSKSAYTITLSSFKYGTEEFQYFTNRAAQSGMRRLKRSCEMANDGVTRELTMFKDDELLSSITIPGK